MRNFFNLDNPVFQFLTRLADLVILHFLCLLCCLPVVTAGAAFTAMAKVTQNLTMEDGASAVFSTFFSAFKGNFKQSTAMWLATLVIFAGLICDYLLLRLFITGALFTVLTCVLVLLGFLVLGILAYLFPLIARYENTWKEHLRNAMILSIYKLPKTFLMVLLHTAPLLLGLFFPDILVYTMPFWVFMGFGFSSQMDSMLLKPVFDKLEQGSPNTAQ